MALMALMVLMTACAVSKQIPTSNVSADDIVCNFFYEYGGGGIYYKTKNLRMEKGKLSDTKEEWERGYMKAIPVEPAENLARILDFEDYTELQLAYGQLYHYENYPIGEVFTFFGNYTGTEDYTIFILNDDDVQKVELKDSNYLFRDLQLHDNYLYLILSEAPEFDGSNYTDSMYVYEFETSGYTYVKYRLNIDNETLFYCKYFLIDHKKIFLASTMNISETNAESIITVIDMETNQSHSVRKNGLASAAIMSIQDHIAVIFGKIIEGSIALPPYVEFYDENLAVVHSRTLSVNDENYLLYLGNFLYSDEKIYLVLKNNINQNCLFMVYDLETDEKLFTYEINPPKTGAIMMKSTFLIHNNGKYYNLF
jgi:hypothetical protein